MSFETRNEKWTGGLRKFIQANSRHSRRVWDIAVFEDMVITHWGQEDGALQEAREFLKPLNVGKANEKTAAEVALDRGRRLALLKYREGYREVVNGRMLEEAETTIDFEDLPQNLCFYKPENSLSVKLDGLARTGKAHYVRKADGLMFVISKGTGKAQLYSRRMLRHNDKETGQEDKTWNVRFAAIAKEADELMPPNSILLGELVCRNSQTGQEDFADVETMTKTLTDQAHIEIANLRKLNKEPIYYVWDIAFWNGEEILRTKTVQERHALMNLHIKGHYVRPIEVFRFVSPEDAIVYAKKRGFEGFVVVDPDGIYGEKAYNFKGKPDRPGLACGKLKPAYEDDFVAMWNPEQGIGERSTKLSNDQGIKSVALYQYNKKGELVFISNVASGLTKERIREWSDPAKFPMVWKVEYTERTYISDGEKTNALKFGRFIAVRTDKAPDECINPRL